MYTTFLLSMLLANNVLGAPTLEDRQMPACRPAMPCYTPSASPTPSPLSPPPPSQPAIVTGDHSPTSAWRKQNYDTPMCKDSWDCNDWCKSQTTSDPDAKEYGVSSTCLSFKTPGAKDFQGKCVCGNGKAVSEMVLGLGDMICIASDIGINGGLNLGAMMVPYVGPESKIIEGVFKLGKKVVKKGTKNCGIEFCPGHKYTVVDPTQFDTIMSVATCL